MRLSTIIRWILVGSLCSGVFFWLLLLIPQGSVRSARLTGVSFIIAASCVPALICAMTLDRGRFRGLMWSGVAASAASAVLWLIIVLMSRSLPRFAEDLLLKCAGSTTIWAGFCLVMSALLHQRFTSIVARVACAIAILFALGMAGLGVHALWTDGRFWRSEDAMGRFFSAGGVVTVVSVLLAMILARMRQFATGDTSEDVVRLPFKTWCPRCGQEQVLHTGGGACAACGLAIRVMVP